MFLSLIPFLRLQHKISSLAIVAEFTEHWLSV